MNKATVTFHDQKGNRTEGWVDKGDKVTIQIQNVPSGIKFDQEVSAQEFLTSPRFDRFGSPEDRLKMLQAGGAQVVEGATLSERQREQSLRKVLPGLFVTAFQSPETPQIELTQNEKPFLAGDWAHIIVKKAQPKYEKTRGEEEKRIHAFDMFPNDSSFTEVLRNSAVQDPPLKKEDLYTEKTQETKNFDETLQFLNGQVDEFIKAHPGWTREDLIQFNWAMGNSEAAITLRHEKGSGYFEDGTVVSGHVKIYLPTDAARGIVEPQLFINKVKEAGEKVRGYLNNFMISW